MSSRAYSTSAYCVSTTTPVSGWVWRSQLAARMPSSDWDGGIRISVKTTSGAVRLTVATSSGNDAHEPTTSMSQNEVNKAVTPARSSSPSSARTTRSEGVTVGC